MKLTKTTLKELTKKYRAVLIKCVMLNFCLWGVYSGSALASDPVDLVIDGVNKTSYSNDSHKNVGIYSTITQSLGDAINSIKTVGDGVEGTVWGIISDSGELTISSIAGGIDLVAKGGGAAAYGLSGGNGSYHIQNLGSIKVKAGDVARGISNGGRDEKNRIVSFTGSSSFIHAESTNNYAYGIYAAKWSTTVSNLGSITAIGKDYSYGIYKDAGTLNVSFNGNGGQAIIAEARDPSRAYSIYTVNGTTNVNFENAILSGKIHNEATLNLTFNNGGIWQVKDGDVSGNVNVSMNGGTIDLKNNAINNLNLGSGKLDLKALSSLKIDVSGGADTTLDKINTTGIIDGSYTLNVVNINILNNLTVDTLTTDAISDNSNLNNKIQLSSSLSTITSGGYIYDVTYDAETGKFTFTKQTGPVPPPPDPDPVPPQGDVIGDVVKGVFSGVKNTVQSTNEAVKASVRGRLAQLSGTPTSSSSASSKKGQSGGDEDETYGLWAQAIYSHVNRDKTGSSAGFKGHSEGVVLGGDAEVAENVIAGFAYAYTNSNMKSNGAKSDIDTHGFYAYGQYKPSDWFINGSIGFGLSKADPKGSNKDIKSKFYSVDTLAGYEMSSDLGNLTPAGGLRYVRIEQDSYREDGSKIEAKDADTLTAVVQLGWNNVYQVAGKEITPKASVGFIYDVKSENNKVTVSSAGAKFLTEDGRLKRFGTEVSVGADAKLTNNWNVSLDYTGEFRQHYENHTGTVSVRYDF